MNVAELIKLLEDYPSGMPVMVQGYEGGFQDVTVDKIKVLDITRVVHKGEWYRGDHEEFNINYCKQCGEDPPDPNSEHEPALILGQ